MTAENLMGELDKLGDPVDAEFLQRFFKTGKGQYGEGDIFIGVRMPVIRKVAKDYKNISLEEVEKILESPIHEHRMAGLVVMVVKAKTATDVELRQLYNLYLKRTDRINNWDLIDVSCRDVVGRYLLDKSKEPLYKLVKSKKMWERRIAIVSTWQFIREGKLDDTFSLSELLLDDKHDLMHKATGWMLREAGKKDEQKLKYFLDRHANQMPRTLLRYSLERLHPADRQYYMALK